MKLTVYQSSKGDCLLLSSGDDKNMLIDGGMSGSFEEHTAEHLSKDIKKLDRICVTHIDQDHIRGILKLCDHILNWKVFNFQQQSGNNTFKKPKSPEPPEIKSFWHNSFDAQFGNKANDVVKTAGLLSSIFSSNSASNSQFIAGKMMGIITSQKEGYELSQKIGSKLLNIPVNKEFNGELLLFKKGKNVFKLGKTTLRVIGPFKEDIDKLRKEWSQWIESASGIKSVEKIKEAINDGAAGLESSSALGLQVAFNNAFIDVEAAVKKLSTDQKGRDGVSTPNLASIMFIAEESGKKILFTGDGHWRDIDKGIEEDGKYNPHEGIHFDVIKVPHHGAVANASLSFWERMTADHYVFCGNGSHHNPEPKVLEDIIKSRKKDISKDEEHSGKPFKFWFNASSSSDTSDNNKGHMKKLEKKMNDKANDCSRISFDFLKGSFFEI